MPTRPSSRCPTCKALHPGTGLCPSCTRAKDRARGTTTQRGYGTQHQRTRDEWQPLVDQGVVPCAALVCLEQNRIIERGQAWDLDHDDDRQGYRGPAHARCNRSTNGGHARTLEFDA